MSRRVRRDTLGSISADPMPISTSYSSTLNKDELVNLQHSRSFPSHFRLVVVPDIARAKGLRSQESQLHLVGHSFEQRVAVDYDDGVDHYPQLVDEAHPKKVCCEIVAAEYGEILAGEGNVQCRWFWLDPSDVLANRRSRQSRSRIVYCFVRRG